MNIALLGLSDIICDAPARIYPQIVALLGYSGWCSRHDMTLPSTSRLWLGHNEGARCLYRFVSELGFSAVSLEGLKSQEHFQRFRLTSRICFRLRSTLG